MISSLARFIEELFDQPAESEDQRTHQMELATAALMLEVARSDRQVDETELLRIRQLLNSAFTLKERELSDLVLLATDRVEAATDLYQFTQRINDAMNYEEKTSLVRNLWGVAYADGRIESYEDHIIRRVAGLLHIAHGDFIKAKIDARPE